MVDFTPRTVRPPGLGIELDVLADDTDIGPAIERGSWEGSETKLFLAHVSQGAHVVDLGANVGWFSVLAILRGARVSAFEPVGPIADLCERNIERANAVGPGRGELFRFAAGSAPADAEIVLAEKNHGDNRVLDDPARKPADLAEAETLAIRVERVDDHVEGPARVIKIDTQGSEWHALQGAERLLAASPEIALLIEFWPYALRGAEPIELLRHLADHGFTIGKATAAPYPMTPERVLEQSTSRDDPVRAGMDLYCTRGVPFHVGSAKDRLRSLWRSLKEA